MEEIIYVLKVVATVLDILFALTVLFFCRGLHWQNKDNRSSIIGFGGMIIAYTLSAVVMWMQ